MKNLLLGKNILVTGCGKGIGYDFVKFAHKQGAFIYGVTRSKIDLAKFRDLKNLKIFIGDVTNSTTIKKIFQYSKKNKKKINCLINNAGVRHREHFLKISEARLKKTFENNFFSVFKITQYFIKYCIENKIKKSATVNIGSIVGKSGFKDLTSYASTKSALYGLTRSLCAEYASLNMRFNVVEPGFIKTSYFTKFKKKKKLYNWTLSRVPSGRWGAPDEISGLIGFLISDYSSYINGESICIDGGWSNT
jgi:NAD(P)-dependent dehydrogenase (short-subunit alcohol dehydrogenase family)